MITLYIDGANGTVSSVQPDLTNRAEVDVSLPDGMPLAFLVSQLTQLNNSIMGFPAQAALIVFKINLGS